MFFWGAKNRYYTQLCCSARVRSWPLADTMVSDGRGSFRGKSGHQEFGRSRQLLTQMRRRPRFAVEPPKPFAAAFNLLVLTASMPPQELG